MEVILSSVLKTVKICSCTLPVIFFSFFIVEILVRTGRMNRVYSVFRPLLRVTGLPPETAGPFMTALASPLAAGAMLKKMHDEKKLSSFELLLAAQTNSLPRYIKEIFTRFFPVMVPILGFMPGLVYTASFLFAGFLKLTAVLAAGAVNRKRKNPGHKLSRKISQTMAVDKKMVLEVLRDAGAHLLRITKIMIPAVFIVNIADSAGALLAVQELLRPLLSLAGIKEEMVLPVLAYAGHSTAGGMMIGTLYRQGTIDFYTASASALAGNLISFSFYLLKFSLARNMAVYGTFLGAAHVVITLTAGIISRVIFLAGFIFIFS